MTNIVSGNSLAEVASLIGDPARANILQALADGRALTAGELAWHAGVSPQTTSGHLAKLADAHLIALEKQGRHRYFRLASPEIAAAMEALMIVAANGPKRYRPTGPKDEALRTARTCYDHLAGWLAVTLADRLSARRLILLADGAAAITAEGHQFFRDFGLDLDDPKSSRPLCRTCLDWSERRSHLAGRLGAALCQRCLDLGWIRRGKDSRAVSFTPKGISGFRETFGISLP
ncbi:ArsR/SmtB family transcription factor [Taklimakanibacter lacteus]|uniref:ArsR/SmtB family transcription factor n=1 Tax=Taklimakanibacter lacteus TaxID=2268456 RepID=UPI000E663A74